MTAQKNSTTFVRNCQTAVDVPPSQSPIKSKIIPLKMSSGGQSSRLQILADLLVERTSNQPSDTLVLPHGLGGFKDLEDNFCNAMKSLLLVVNWARGEIGNDSQEEEGVFTLIFELSEDVERKLALINSHLHRFDSETEQLARDETLPDDLLTRYRNVTERDHFSRVIREVMEYTSKFLEIPRNSLSQTIASEESIKRQADELEQASNDKKASNPPQPETSSDSTGNHPPPLPNRRHIWAGLPLLWGTIIQGISGFST